jgi:hypothetical protein
MDATRRTSSLVSSWPFVWQPSEEWAGSALHETLGQPALRVSSRDSLLGCIKPTRNNPAKIADALGLSDDVVLLPHLKSLASAENVVAINPRR